MVNQSALRNFLESYVSSSGMQSALLSLSLLPEGLEEEPPYLSWVWTTKEYIGIYQKWLVKEEKQLPLFNV